MTPMLSRVPNQPKTPMRSFRCPSDLWDAARLVADDRDETLTAVLQEALRRYVKRGAADKQKPPPPG